MALSHRSVSPRWGSKLPRATIHMGATPFLLGYDVPRALIYRFQSGPLSDSTAGAHVLSTGA